MADNPTDLMEKNPFTNTIKNINKNKKLYFLLEGDRGEILY